jgi:hypothetical protein
MSGDGLCGWADCGKRAVGPLYGVGRLRAIVERE